VLPTGQASTQLFVGRVTISFGLDRLDAEATWIVHRENVMLWRQHMVAVLLLETVRQVLKIAKGPITLETPVHDDGDESHCGDVIGNKNARLPIDAAIQSNLRETTTRVLASLTPREERVLRMRFGIGMNTDHTLEEVGQPFSVTRERSRQTEAKALRKLKHRSRSRKLRRVLDS
jgi:RNA polymerase primary sigma factor